MLDRRAWSRIVRLLSGIAVLVAILHSRPAHAYPWMIRHEYQGCVPCHADPSGAGLLTEYGRAMGENVLRMRYGTPPPDEMPKYARFLFGVPTPDWLLLGGSVRGGIQFLDTPSAAPPPPNPPYTSGHFSILYLQMETDLRAQVTVKRFRAYGGLGYMHLNASTTQITTRPTDNLVSREHWIGVDLGEDKQFLLRAGRIDVPFGIRTDEHDLLVRNTQTTRTNINESQQYGLALYYGGQAGRGEIMALLGNYVVNPDAARERGYAGYFEFNVASKAAFGLSSLVTYAQEDYLQTMFKKEVRQVHGVFTRYSPVTQLVLFSEVDAIVTTTSLPTDAGGLMPGVIGMLQADVEPVQGLHIVATGEAMAQGNMPSTMGGAGALAKSWDAGLAVLWFFAPHADFRFDFVTSSVMNQPMQVYLLPQLHLYL
jgi:hypothetical protein